jgi:thiamine kinase-like enzyme
MSQELAAIIAGIPALATFKGQPQRLGGLTNRVFRVGEHVLRVPGAGTGAYINRAHEATAARLAAEAGVSPAVVHANPDTGLMVTEFIQANTMTPQGFRTTPGAPERAGQVLARLHRSGVVFPFRFELFGMIDSYLALLAPRDMALPPGYHDVVAEAEAVRAALSRTPLPLTACHCDPLCENFLDDGSRMWVVDWEYSGMNDPMWDLGDLSVEAGMDEGHEDAMLTAYFGHPARAGDRGRMVAYKAMCDLLWTLWGLIQLSDGNPADDFRAYADGRFARCKALMGQAEFSRHLAAIGGTA